MLAPIDHAWMLLKAGPTEREQRNMNEGMEPFQANMVDSHYPHMRGEEEELDNQELSNEPTAGAPTTRPPIDEAMESLRGGGAPWQEGPTLGELADMDPEEGEHHMREAGRRSAAPSDPPQRTLHDY